MKIEICQREKKDENKLRKYFEMLILVFVLTVGTLIFTFNKINEISEKQKDQWADYVSVFKESELHGVLFPSNEKDENSQG